MRVSCRCCGKTLTATPAPDGGYHIREHQDRLSRRCAGDGRTDHKPVKAGEEK